MVPINYIKQVNFIGTSLDKSYTYSKMLLHMIKCK